MGPIGYVSALAIETRYFRVILSLISKHDLCSLPVRYRRTMIRCKFIFALFLLPILAQSGHALTWKQCLDEATKNNPSYAAAIEAVKGAEASLKGSRSAYYPQVSAGANVSRSGSDTATGNTESDSRSADLSVQQTIFSGFKDQAVVDQARIAWEVSRIELWLARAEVEFELRQAYLQALYANEQIHQAESIAKRREDNARLVALNYKGGVEHKGSNMRSQAQASQARFEVEQAKRALQTALQRLAAAIGWSEMAEVSLSGELSASPPEKANHLLDLVRKTPEYAIAEANVGAARVGLRVAKSGWYPDVSASASLSKSGEHNFNDEGWRAGLGLSWPIFTGGETRYGIWAARSSLAQAEYNLKNTQDQILSSMQNDLNQYFDAYGNMKVQTEFLAAAETRAEIARTQYAQGLISYEDWDLIENDLIQNQKSMLSAKLDVATAEATWRRVTGQSDIQ